MSCALCESKVHLNFVDGGFKYFKKNQMLTICFISIHTTTGFRAFAESRVPLCEGPFPLSEGFTESLLSAKASQRTATSECLFAESYGPPSRWMFAERSILLSVKKIL
jgi:hypothetical protein